MSTIVRKLGMYKASSQPCCFQQLRPAKFLPSDSTLAVTWDALISKRVYKEVKIEGLARQQQSIAISVVKCIAALYKQSTGYGIELSHRCLIEKVTWTGNRDEDIASCFNHATTKGIYLAANWPYWAKYPRNDSQKIFIQGYEIKRGEYEIEKELSGRPLVGCVASHKSLNEKGKIITYQTGEEHECLKLDCPVHKIKSLCLNCGYGTKWVCVVLTGYGPEVWQFNTVEGEFGKILKKSGSLMDPNQIYGPLGVNQVAWYPLPPKRWNK